MNRTFIKKKNHLQVVEDTLRVSYHEHQILFWMRHTPAITVSMVGMNREQSHYAFTTYRSIPYFESVSQHEYLQM